MKLFRFVLDIFPMINNLRFKYWFHLEIFDIWSNKLIKCSSILMYKLLHVYNWQIYDEKEKGLK